MCVTVAGLATLVGTFYLKEKCNCGDAVLEEQFKIIRHVFQLRGDGMLYIYVCEVLTKHRNQCVCVCVSASVTH